MISMSVAPLAVTCETCTPPPPTATDASAPWINGMSGHSWRDAGNGEWSFPRSDLPLEDIANVVIQKKELYGDELVKLLNGANLQIPDVDLTDDKVWPKL